MTTSTVMVVALLFMPQAGQTGTQVLVCSSRKKSSRHSSKELSEKKLKTVRICIAYNTNLSIHEYSA